jgi:hypothetical protein
MINVMLDLETFGTSAVAPIVAIGAVEFDLESRTIGQKFYQNIDLASSASQGAVIDPDTVVWWMGQSDEARSALSGNEMHIAPALVSFSLWCNQCADEKSLRVWGNCAAFDNVILRGAFERGSIQVPWKFYNDMSYRTLKNLYPNIHVTREGTHHNALHDAEHQVRHLFAIMDKIEGKDDGNSWATVLSV